MKQELIGCHAKVVYSGAELIGVITDETMHMLHLETSRGLKKIIKKNATIMINNITISGKDIDKRPEDRIKK